MWVNQKLNQMIYNSKIIHMQFVIQKAYNYVRLFIQSLDEHQEIYINPIWCVALCIS